MKFFQYDHVFNPLPDDKSLALSKLKAFADDNFIVAETVQNFDDRAEKNVGKGENAGYQHFLLFPHFFFLKMFPTLYREKLYCEA